MNSIPTGGDTFYFVWLKGVRKRRRWKNVIWWFRQSDQRRRAHLIYFANGLRLHFTVVEFGRRECRAIVSVNIWLLLCIFRTLCSSLLCLTIWAFIKTFVQTFNWSTRALWDSSASIIHSARVLFAVHWEQRDHRITKTARISLTTELDAVLDRKSFLLFTIVEGIAEQINRIREGFGL